MHAYKQTITEEGKWKKGR